MWEREKTRGEKRRGEEGEEGEERNIQSGRVTSRRELFFMARTTRETSVVRDFTLLKLVITSTLTSDKQEEATKTRPSFLPPSDSQD